MKLEFVERAAGDEVVLRCGFKGEVAMWCRGGMGALDRRRKLLRRDGVTGVRCWHRF